MLLQSPQNTRILGCDLLLTCYACPEQYDVTLNGEQLGYLRLRHGRFTASYPDVGGADVYTAYPMGDGIFEDQERGYHLTQAVMGLLAQRNGTTFNVTLGPGLTIDLNYSELISLKNQIDRLFEPK